jgi:diguanylate cyclase (GGDEF)-like protein
MTEQLAAKIKNAPNLPSLPAIAVQVLELAQRPEVDIAEIARTISKDPALSGKILRTVNSSFYGRSNNVGTISHALVILGLQSVKTLVLGFSLVGNLTKNKTRGFNHIAYWKRSIYAATAARALAARINLVQQEEAFLATLLADIGTLVLDQVAGEAYGEIHERITSHAELCAAERNGIGATHAEVGGMLAEMWKLPVMLAAPIAHHHDPAAVTEPSLRKLAELVHVAGRCADVFVDEQAAPAIAEVRSLCAERYALGGTECDALMEDIGKRTQEVAGLFELNVDSPAEYAAILKRANQTLVDLTLETQQQATSLAEHASTLTRQATTLQQRNEQLEQRATTDRLTGLANRARLDDVLAAAFARPATEHGGGAVALLMIDLDRFKKVNDRLGHQAGDAVLKVVARVLQAAAGKDDLAARYGGDELAVVLLGTTREAAARLAETVRRSIAARSISTGNTHVKVTASIGVALWEPGSPLGTPAHLIKAADLAVYNAKHAGRDRVKVFTLKQSGGATSTDQAKSAAA